MLKAYNNLYLWWRVGRVFQISLKTLDDVELFLPTGQQFTTLQPIRWIARGKWTKFPFEHKEKNNMCQILKRNIKKIPANEIVFQLRNGFSCFFNIMFHFLILPLLPFTSSYFVSTCLLLWFFSFFYSLLPCALILFCVPHSSQIWLLTSCFRLLFYWIWIRNVHEKREKNSWVRTDNGY